MKNKKVWALFLAVTMSIGCLAGCGQTASKEVESSASESTTVKESESTVEKEETPLFNVGELPIVNEAVTLKVLTQDDPNSAWEKAADAELWAWLEEKTGIHFEVESYPAEELKSKLPLIMATPDEMPDLFIRCNLSSADVQTYGANGQLLMLDEYIEAYGANINECFDTLDYAYGAAVSPDGHIYSLPAFNGGAAINKYAMNTKFLEAVNMEVPTTIEELYEVFKAIKAHGDADGDGVKGNEICWSGTLGHFRPTALGMVGINNYWPTGGCLFDDKNQEVYFVPTSDAYKYMLEWLNTFYEEGMIDPEVFTQNNDEYKAKLAEGRIFLKKAADDPESASFAGIEGDFYPETPIHSEISEPFVQIGASYQTDIGAVSAYTEYPEVCVLLLDYLFTEEGTKVARFGQEGKDYAVTSNDPWIIESTVEGHGLGQGYTPVLTSRWVRDDMVQPAATEMGRKLNEWGAEYGVMAFQNYLKFTDEETETINVIGTDLGLYTDDYFVGFVTGEYDIETEWDAYVEKCNSMKAEELTAVYQQAYNRFYGLD